MPLSERFKELNMFNVPKKAAMKLQGILEVSRKKVVRTNG